MRLDSGENGREKTHPFNRPAEDGCLEVFRLGELATLEDSDRVDDAQPPVEFPTRDIVVHALLGGQEHYKKIIWVYEPVDNNQSLLLACCVCGNRQEDHRGRLCTQIRIVYERPPSCPLELCWVRQREEVQRWESGMQRQEPCEEENNNGGMVERLAFKSIKSVKDGLTSLC